jgi:hypothetical protein
MNRPQFFGREERIANWAGHDHPPSPADELLRLGAFARATGWPFVGDVLEAGYRQLHRGPRTAAMILGWPGDPAAAALAMRFNAALHLLARKDRVASLSALYRREHDDFDGAIAQALASEDEFIAVAMRNPTQTNEVGRAASILSALLELTARTGLPCELLELGASCGLNLNLGHYAYDLNGMTWGSEDSPVRIAPRWTGPQPRTADLRILSARGVDLSPFDACNPETVDRLMSFVWSGDVARSSRLAQALDLARRHRPRVDRGDALHWLEQRLADPHRNGVCRVVYHSMFRQYLSEADSSAMQDMIERVGARADSDRPLAWISFEWTADRREVRLLLTTWPGGETRHLATCDPYGSWIDWKQTGLTHSS